MPRIPIYNSQVQAPGAFDQPRANPDTMGAALGRGVEQFGKAIKDVGETMFDIKEGEEITDSTVKAAQFQVDKSKEWQDILQKAKKDANLDELKEDFDRGVYEGLEDIRSNVTTRRADELLRRQNAELGANFQEMTGAGVARLKGIRAKQQTQQAIGARSSAVLSDPASFQTTLSLNESHIEATIQSGMLPREVGEELKASSSKEIARSAIRGWYQLDPAGTKKQLETGEWDQYLDGDHKRALIGEVDNEIRGRETEAARLRSESERIKKEKQVSIQNEFLQNMVEGKLSANDVLRSNLEPFGQGSKRQFLDMMQAEATRPVRSNPAVVNDIFRRIHLADGDEDKMVDENDINQYVIDGKISMTDANRLRREFQGKGTTQGKIESDMKRQVEKVARQQLVKTNPMLGIADAEGEENMLKYMQFFQEEFANQRKQGKTATQLLSPESPDYLGKHIRQFVKTPQEIMKGNMKRLQPATIQQAPAKPRAQGESPADYLKRIKGNP
jgi:hypothetical protein